MHHRLLRSQYGYKGSISLSYSPSIVRTKRLEESLAQEYSTVCYLWSTARNALQRSQLFYFQWYLSISRMSKASYMMMTLVSVSFFLQTGQAKNSPYELECLEKYSALSSQNYKCSQNSPRQGISIISMLQSGGRLKVKGIFSNFFLMFSGLIAFLSFFLEDFLTKSLKWQKLQYLLGPPNKQMEPRVGLNTKFLHSGLNAEVEELKTRSQMNSSSYSLYQLFSSLMVIQQLPDQLNFGGGFLFKDMIEVSLQYDFSSPTTNLLGIIIVFILLQQSTMASLGGSSRGKEIFSTLRGYQLFSQIKVWGSILWNPSLTRYFPSLLTITGLTFADSSLVDLASSLSIVLSNNLYFSIVCEPSHMAGYLRAMIWFRFKSSAQWMQKMSLYRCVRLLIAIRSFLIDFSWISP